MKLLISFLFISLFSFSQTEDIIEFADVDAKFPGGAAALKKFVLENLEFPSACAEMGAQGRVFVKFCARVSRNRVLLLLTSRATFAAESAPTGACSCSASAA